MTAPSPEGAAVTFAEPGLNALADDWPTSRQAWWSLIVLAAGTAVGTIDRSVVSLVVVPMKRDFAMTDTEFSLVTGFAFVFFYAIVGLPISRLADVHSRRLIVACSMLFWGTATMMCGVARNFQQMFWARVGVGAGESAFSPATFSIVTDSFPPARLPMAMAILTLGFTLGNALANFVGGAMVTLLDGTPPIVLPLFGTIHGWQLVFFVAGAPAILLGLLMATTHEPKRKGFRDTRLRDSRTAVPMRQVLRHLRDERRVLVPIFTVVAVKVIITFGMTMWVPALFVRSFGWSIGEIALALGLIALLSSPAGLWCGVRMARHYERRGRADANLRVMAITVTLSTPFTIAFALAPSGWLALAFFGASQFFYYMGQGPNNAALQLITPNELRGQVRAIYQFIFNVVGYGSGPLLVALFTDLVFQGDEYLRYSIALMAVTLSPILLIGVWASLKPYAAALERAKAWR